MKDYSDNERLQQALNEINHCLVELLKQDVLSMTHRERNKSCKEIARKLIKAQEALRDCEALNPLPF